MRGDELDLLCEGTVYEVWYHGFQPALGSGFTIWTIPRSETYLFRRFNSNACSLLSVNTPSTQPTCLVEPDAAWIQAKLEIKERLDAFEKTGVLREIPLPS